MALTMTRKGTVKVEGLAVRKPRKNAVRKNTRIHLVGTTGSARAHVYTPTALPEGTVIRLKVSDAETKALEHGEERLVWNDKDQQVLVKAFIPLAERGVKAFRITV